MKWKSCVQWPTGKTAFSVSTEEHDSEAAARSVCAMMRRDGFRAESKVFPLRTWIEFEALCLSVRQPWAWLIVNGWKNIENRTWHTKVRGKIVIHAAVGMTRDEYRACQIFVSSFASLELPSITELKFGGIVGQATILDCVTAHQSDWFCGPYGFVLDEQRPSDFIQCRGALGFFKVQFSKPA
jgi:hypothetical protein